MSEPDELPWIVVRPRTDISHPWVNRWLRRTDASPLQPGGELLFAGPELYGLAVPTSEVEACSDDGTEAQVYRLVDVDGREV